MQYSIHIYVFHISLLCRRILVLTFFCSVRSVSANFLLFSFVKVKVLFQYMLVLKIPRYKYSCSVNTSLSRIERTTTWICFNCNKILLSFERQYHKCLRRWHNGLNKEITITAQLMLSCSKQKQIPLTFVLIAIPKTQLCSLLLS